MKLPIEEVFLGYGLNSAMARRLAKSGVSPGKLRTFSDSKLEKLGLNRDVRKTLKRPAIPFDTLFRVLQKSRRTCCVCHRPGRTIIIHHIKEWHKSRSHKENNLAVLCLNDHGEAHTRRQLGQNLTASHIEKHKAQWEARVAQADARALIGLSRVAGANWDYINHTRLLRLATQLRIDTTSLPEFVPVSQHGIVSRQGLINDTSVWRTAKRPLFYLYDLAEGRDLYAYTSKILELVIERLGVVDVSSLNRVQVEAIAEDGALVFYQGPFYFRREPNDPRKGAGQLRRSYMKNTALEIDFSFDAWECTSTSSWGNRLSGRKVASVVGIVSGRELRARRVLLQLSCLAVGTSFERIHWGEWHDRVSRMIDDNQLDEGVILPTEMSLSDVSSKRT